MYYVYIAANQWNTVLYIGVTNDVVRRMREHKNKINPGFTSQYNVNKLLFIEEFKNVHEALEAEKKIKGWRRDKKLQIIKEQNPELKDLLIP